MTQPTSLPARTRLRADLMLLLVSVIWGSAFVAQRVAAVQAGVFWFNGLRFLLGALVLLPFALRRGTVPVRLTPSQRYPWMLLAGGLLFAGAALQQAGLKYTTAGNAGFITGLYVVIIPILLAIFWKHRARPAIWLAAGMSALGLFLLSTGGQITQPNPGDLLELAGAFLWALHVILVGILVMRFDFLDLAIGQYLACAGLSLLAGLLFERGMLPGLIQSWPAILYTGILSVGVGYTLQVAAQRVAPPADAAIILSTEAVFAALFGWLLLDEILTPVQLLGCAIIFTGMLLSQVNVLRVKGSHTMLLLGLAGLMLVSACSRPTTHSSPTLVVLPSQTPTTQATEAATLTPKPSATPAPATATPRPALQVCSPLKGFELAQLPGLVANPYNPPAPGHDEPHHGVDLAVTDPATSIALRGNPVQAVLGGRVAMITQERFPYGNAVLIEVPMYDLPDSWISSPVLPTLAPTLVPHPALTCPDVPSVLPEQFSERSLYLLYAHLDQPSTLKAGQRVTCGQELGAIGASGNALNPHLHLEARLGPAGASWPSLAHYDSSASPLEMAAYCAWRVSGAYQLIDPLQLLASLP